MNFSKTVQNILERKNNDQSKYANLLSNNEIKKYVIGKNDQSAELILNYSIDGLIDDFNQASKTWNGVPVVSTKDLTVDSVIFNCVTSVSPVQVNKNLTMAGLKNVVPVSELISKEGNILKCPWFVKQQRDEVTKNLELWVKLFERLADQESKNTLLDVTLFRLTANVNYMNKYSTRLSDQYFEDFMGYTNEIFVDAGGFDGDSTEEFVRRYPDYQKVYFFEPSERNLTAAKLRLSGTRDIDFRNVGLSDSSGTLFFDPNAGSASAITKAFGEKISVVALDEELKGQSISFIKMDLEGWELNSLKGASKLIADHKPKLAIAVYHDAKDFREVPEFVLGINPDYRVFLRHYTEGWSETVMYFT